MIFVNDSFITNLNATIGRHDLDWLYPWVTAFFPKGPAMTARIRSHFMATSGRFADLSKKSVMKAFPAVCPRFT